MVKGQAQFQAGRRQGRTEQKSAPAPHWRRDTMTADRRRPFSSEFCPSRFTGLGLAVIVLALSPMIRLSPGLEGGQDLSPLAQLSRGIELGISLAHATENTIVEIRVAGNVRTEKEAILAQVRSREGAAPDQAIVSDDIRRIYGLGFFQDIQVTLEETPQGVILTYIVEEKPAIREVRFEGNDRIKNDDVEEVVNLQPFSILDIAAVARNAQKIRELYTEKGFFLSEIDYEIKPATPSEVDVVFLIRENAKVMVRSITILGNDLVPDSDIKDVMLTKEGSFFSFLTSAGTFREDVFERDAMMISSLYLDRGFINIKVDRPILSLSPDKSGIYITITLNEGDQYSLDAVGVKGDLLLPEEELLDLVKAKPGDIFSRSELFADIGRVSSLYKDDGYAFVNVTPLTYTDQKNKTISVTLDIQKGNKVHFGRIEIKGNFRTRDKVIRRELEIVEGEEYSGTKLDLSRRNILRLGFFEGAEINTSQGTTPDTVDVTVEVAERQTGSFQLGMGFSSLEQFIGTAQVSESNLFGRGQTLSLMATLSGVRQYINLSFTEPRFLDTKWIFSFNLFNYEMAYDEFVRSSLGGDVTLGYQLTPKLSTSLTYGYANIDMRRQDRPEELESGVTSSVRAGVAYDSRDNRLFPTSGFFNTASVEVAPSLLGSDNLFNRYRLQSRYYHPLPLGMVFKAAARYGLVVSTGNRPVPLSERFFVGGIYSVRGFERNSLGPRQPRSGASPDYPLVYLNEGGNQELVLNFEIEFPIFEAAGIRGVIFTDVGQAYNQRQVVLTDPDLLFNGDQLHDPLRASWGFGFRWFSPLGPLRFEWGFPFNPGPGERPMVFEFTIGNF